MKTTKEELAEMLNGMEYGNDIPEETHNLAKKNGLVIVYGHSDDLMEFEGAIDDEIGCYEGGLVLVVKPNKKYELYDEDEDAYISRTFEDFSVVSLEEESGGAGTGENMIESLWCEGDIAWTYKTDIPHSTFDIIEDGDIYCRGIVFALSDLK